MHFCLLLLENLLIETSKSNIYNNFSPGKILSIQYTHHHSHSVCDRRGGGVSGESGKWTEETEKVVDGRTAKQSLKRLIVTYRVKERS